MIYSEATKYLTQERGLTPETITEHNLAFCNKQGFLYAKTSYPKDFTRLEEKFFDSIIFPIYDVYGSPIGIMSRPFWNSRSKYINSTGSNLFTKGRHLYGLDKSHPYILKENQVIVVEGNFDFLALYQMGIRNTVAMMGTSLSETQIALLSRFTSNIIVLPDNDQAGIRAGQKSKKVIGKHATCHYVTLPTKLDPDDWIRQIGTAAFKEYIANAI